MTQQIPTVTLNNGVEMPQLGFGVFQVPDDETRAAVADRPRGRLPQHRHRRGLRQRGRRRPGARRLRHRPRGALRHHQAVELRAGLRPTLAAFDASLEQARPRPRRPLPDPLAHPGRGPVPRHVAGLRGALRRRAGSAPIGVSNFQPEHLERLVDARRHGARPSTRSSCTPRLQQRELRAVHAEHGIVTEAWSPLAQGASLLDDEAITAIADRHGAHAGAGRPALAPAAGQRRDPQVGRRPSRIAREHRRLRLRAHRRRPRRDRRPRARRACRVAPG